MPDKPPNPKPQTLNPEPSVGLTRFLVLSVGAHEPEDLRDQRPRDSNYIP